MNYLIDTPFGKKKFINADMCASGCVHASVENFINTYVYPYYSNTHSNSFNGKYMVNLIDQSKDIIRRNLNIRKEDKIIFTGSGTTGAISLLIHSIKPILNDRTVIFLSIAEHHSNYLPWTHLKLKCIIIPLKHGIIDIEILKLKLLEYKDWNIICSFTACSNVTGIIMPTQKIASLIHKYKGLIFFDFAASAPYVKINVNSGNDSYYDAIFISPHKFLGGVGTPGLLVARHELFKNEIPYYPGGGTVRFVCRKFKHYSDDPEISEQGATPNIVGSIRTGLAFMLKEQNQTYIELREKEINNIAINFFRMNPEIKLIGLTDNIPLNKIPIYSFQIKDFHYNYIVVLMNDLFGIQTRGGISCCSVYAQSLLKIEEDKQKKIYDCIIAGKGTPNNYGWCRITLNYMMCDSEVYYILDAIKYIYLYGENFKNEYEFIPKGSSYKHKNYEYNFTKLSL